MKEIISKELLSEVLDREVSSFQTASNPNDLAIGFKDGNSYSSFDLCINIYELQHKCKEWAYTQGYVIITWNESPHFFDSEWQSEIFKIGEITANKRQRLNFFYWLNSEPEAIFKATSYIMELLKQKD